MRSWLKRQIYASAPILCLGAAVASGATGHDAFLGLWGTARQCAGDVIMPGGTQRAEPFEIREGWLRHGEIWCALIWFPVQHHDSGAFVSTRAQCGEDSQQAYRLDMVLGFQGSPEELLLIWNETLTNGPLRRCFD